MGSSNNFLKHLEGIEHSDPNTSAALTLNLLLGSFILTTRPRNSLEIGIGAGELTVTMVHALNMNHSGQLTCVDDWSAWRGREPEGIDALREAGVSIAAPINPRDFIRSDQHMSFDLVVCRADIVDAPNGIAQLNRLLSPEGWLLIHRLEEHRRPLLEKQFETDKNFERVSWASFPSGPNWLFVQKGRKIPRNKAIDAKSNRRSERLFLGLVRGEGYGWGVCSRYLIAELSKVRSVHILNDDDGSSGDSKLKGPLFQALTDIHFHAMFPNAKGEKNIGYTFFENELTTTSIENAKRYDLVLGGSTWCRDRMREKGINHCDVLIQGVDPAIFFPVQTKKRDDRFVIFSGGKFELRKGQDLVLRAVKIIQDKYPDVWLVNCWYNLWPASTRLMSYSRHIRFEHHENEKWVATMRRTYAQNGMDPRRIVTHELVPQAEQREIYAQTDIGLFPNRCEGGTNLVLMEYMACAKPVIASFTSGHKDILTPQNALLLNRLENYHVRDGEENLIARWQEPNLDEIVERLEFAYRHRDEVRAYGVRAGQDLQRFTWQASAGQLLAAMDSNDPR